MQINILPIDKSRSADMLLPRPSKIYGEEQYLHDIRKEVDEIEKGKLIDMYV